MRKEKQGHEREKERYMPHFVSDLYKKSGVAEGKR